MAVACQKTKVKINKTKNINKKLFRRIKKMNCLINNLKINPEFELNGNLK